MVFFRRSVAATALVLGLLALGKASAKEKPELSLLSAVALVSGTEAVVVTLAGSRAPDFTSFTLSEPFRVVVDWAGSRLEGAGPEKSFEQGLVRRISTRQFEAEGEKITRVTIELAKRTTYHVEAKDTKVLVRFAPVPELAPLPPLAAVEEAPEVIEGPLTEPDEPIPAVVPVAVAAAKAAPAVAEKPAVAEVARPLAAEKAAAEEAQRLAAAKAAAEEARRLAAEEAAAEEAKRLAAEKAAAEEAKRLAAEKAAEDARRLAAEKAAEEAKRLAAEKAAEEAKRLAAEKAAAEEARRLAAEKAAEEAKRLAAEKAAEEAKRLAAEKAAAEEAKRVAAEKAAAEEASRVAAEKAAAEEARRVAAEKAAEEAKRLAAAKAAEEAKRLAEQAAAQEAKRLAAEKAAAEEAKRVAAEQAAAAEAKRLAERAAAQEAERVAAAKAAAPVELASYVPPAQAEQPESVARGSAQPLASATPGRQDAQPGFGGQPQGRRELPVVRLAMAQETVEPAGRVPADPDEPRGTIAAKPAPALPASADANDFDPGPRELKYIGFQQMAGTSRVFVRLDGKAKYRQIKDGAKFVLELANTSVPVKNNTRPLDTTYFDSPVLEVKAVPARDATRVEVTLRENVPVSIKRIGTTLAIDFKRGG